MAPETLAQIRIVLVRPRNPLNIGAAARAMANFGLSDLVLVEPYTKAFQRARSARAGAGILEQARCVATLAEAVSDRRWIVGTTDGNRRTPALPLEDWRNIAAAWPAGPAALVFGSEKTGLSVEDLSYCRQLARLPTIASAPSMNLGQAVAICCYELIRRNGEAAAGRPSQDSATAGERERIVERFYPVLEAVGVVREQHRRSQSQRLRQMLERWQLSSSDTRLLLGLARELRRVLRLPR